LLIYSINAEVLVFSVTCFCKFLFWFSQFTIPGFLQFVQYLLFQTTQIVPDGDGHVKKPSNPKCNILLWETFGITFCNAY